MTGHRQVQIFEWLSSKGIHVDAPKWFIETVAGAGAARRIAHTTNVCPKSRTPFEGEGSVLGFQEVAESHFFCESCLPQALDPSLAPHAAAELHRQLLGLQRTGMLVENAGSTFHVVIAKEYPALHAAVLHDVEPHLRRELGKDVGHLLYDRARVVVAGELDGLVAALPYDAAAALDEAILLAARWRFVEFRHRDLFERRLKEHSDPVRDLGTRMLESVRRPGQAHGVAERLVNENAVLAAELPSLSGILRAWADVLDGALTDTAPTYFASGGLPMGLNSVPRSPIRWILWQGVRAHHHHWGLGELPKVLLEYVAHACRNSSPDGNVSIIDVPYEPLSEEAWLTADALWKEHMHMRRDEVIYAHPGEAILAAARL